MLRKLQLFPCMQVNINKYKVHSKILRNFKIKLKDVTNIVN